MVGIWVCFTTCASEPKLWGYVTSLKAARAWIHRERKSTSELKYEWLTNTEERMALSDGGSHYIEVEKIDKIDIGG